MSNTILVTYASRTGSTVGVAEAIGKTLTESGLQVEVLPMTEVKDLTLYIAVVAWSAARFLLHAEDQARGSERLQAEYDKLPNGTELIGLSGTSHVLFKAQLQLRATLPLTDVLEVHALLRGTKSDAKGKALAKRLYTSSQ